MRFLDKELSRREAARLILLAAPVGCLTRRLDGRNAASVNKSEHNANQSCKNKKIAKTAFVYDPVYLRHRTPDGFPERPQRLSAIVERLEQKNLLAKLANPPYRKDGAKWIPAIHAQEYMTRIQNICRKGSGYIDSPDVPVSKDSYNVAVAAVGGTLAAVDAVMAGKIRNAFCALRPPGHHALRNKAMGFCLFNNIAVAARYIQKKYKLNKVLIIDWDVHHGNGTQEAFYNDPTVLYFSIHQSPFYPGTGSKQERGAGKGIGYTINAPRPAGCGDKEYIKVFEEILKPAALEYKPDFVLISAGFDAHKDDPLGGMKVTAGGFAKLTQIVMDIAGQCCSDRIVSILEGGYNLSALADSVEEHVKTLME